MNVQRVTHEAWTLYLLKYVMKVRLYYLSLMRLHAVSEQEQHVKCSVNVLRMCCDCAVTDCGH